MRDTASLQSNARLSHAANGKAPISVPPDVRTTKLGKTHWETTVPRTNNIRLGAMTRIFGVWTASAPHQHAAFVTTVVSLWASVPDSAGLPSDPTPVLSLPGIRKNKGTQISAVHVQQVATVRQARAQHMLALVRVDTFRRPQNLPAETDQIPNLVIPLARALRDP